MPQLIAIRQAPANTSAQTRGGIVTIARHPRTMVSTIADTTSDHTIRCARISSAPAGSSSGKNSGNRPQIR